MLGTSTTGGKITNYECLLKPVVYGSQSSGFTVILFLQDIDVQIKIKRSLSF